MYNTFILQQFNAPYHQGKPQRIDATGQQGIPGEGPYMIVHLCQAAGQPKNIEQAWFETYGCPAAIACGSWLVRWLEGKTLDEAGKIEAKDLAIVLGGLPLGKEHCAQMTIKALQRGLVEMQK
ncbi:MAG TPA: iron-sulfur cluster assembly scaffold protein [Abditibacteriaceae bacterium]|jgi:nitrogen fixation NifU-like protein